MDQSQSWTSHSQGMLQSWTSHNHSFIQHNFIDRKRRLLHLHYQLLMLLHDNALYTFIHLLGEPTRAGFLFIYLFLNPFYKPALSQLFPHFFNTAHIVQ